MISFFLITPLGFFMGMFFPTGMKLLRMANLSLIIPKMWAVNGIGSVLGATLSISISISYGFSYAILLGGVTYLFIVVMAVAIRSRTLQIRGGKRFDERKVPGFTPIPVRSSHFENSREPVSL
jgi:hypothetical protein